MLKDNGDIVQALGFVTLYSGYMEGEVDQLLRTFHFFETYDEFIMKWPISKKIRRAKKMFKNIIEALDDDSEGNDNWSEDVDKINDLIASLSDCLIAFRCRNKYIHGYIYSDITKQTRLKSSISDTIITSKELYNSANTMFSLKGCLAWINIKTFGFTVNRIKIFLYSKSNRSNP
jgi:hypothetical protein